MAKSVITPAIDYPCSNGQPMSESDLHIVCMSYVLQALKRHLASTRGSPFEHLLLTRSECPRKRDDPEPVCFVTRAPVTASRARR